MQDGEIFLLQNSAAPMLVPEGQSIREAWQGVGRGQKADAGKDYG